MEKFFLKKVYFILSHSRQLILFGELIKKLLAQGIDCEAVLAEESWPILDETLYMTDSSQAACQLAEAGLPVLVCYHEGNRREDFSGVRYGVEQPQELEPTYLERVYRRYAGLPWEILETKRCILRESTVEDVDSFYSIYKEPAVTRYTENLYESRVTEQAYIREYIEQVYAYYEFGVWTVILKETGEIIGRAGLSVREGYELPELGYIIGVPWQGKGLAEEVCRGILDYAKEEFGFEKVQALIQKENVPSICLAEKLGFVSQMNFVRDGVEYIFFACNT